MSQTKINVGMIDGSGTPGSGNFLRGDGSWQAASGAFTFINTSDISNAATYSFTAVDASSYDGYAFFLHNVVPVTDEVDLYFRTSTDGGSTYDSGAGEYSWTAISDGSRYNASSATEISFTSANSGASVAVGSATNEPGVSGWVYLVAPHLTKYTFVCGTIHYWCAGSIMQNSISSGVRISNADVDALQMLFSSGNIETGTVTAYGIANA